MVEGCREQSSITSQVDCCRSDWKEVEVEVIIIIPQVGSKKKSPVGTRGCPKFGVDFKGSNDVVEFDKFLFCNIIYTYKLYV